jgi:hypothetical protein
MFSLSRRFLRAWRWPASYSPEQSFRPKPIQTSLFICHWMTASAPPQSM